MILTNYGLSFDSRDELLTYKRVCIIIWQTLPIYADKSYIANYFTASKYKSLNEDVNGVSKLYISTINGLSDDDVRLSKRVGLSTKRLRGFKKIELVQLIIKIILVEIMQLL